MSALISEESISVVVPVYGCREALPELHRRLVEALARITNRFEIILVDDHCPQGSWEDIQKICAIDHRVRGVELSRNFGQARAILAGLERAKGDWVVVMDCDLQDRPESIVDLFNKAHEGYDVVFAKRVDRKDNRITKALSRSFYRVYNYFTNGTYDPSLSNFSIADRKVVDSYCRMREHNRAYTMFIKWLGFKQVSLELEGDERFTGESSYSFKKKMNLAISLITTQSNKPLFFSVNVGFCIAFISFIFLLYLVIGRLLAPASTLPGWTSIVGSVFLMGGLILAAIGIVGIYIGNIFAETKNRPLYIVSEELNKGDLK